jgi:arylsulfatase
MTDRTIVVFTADHGEMAGAHGLRGKGPFAYEESIHVPFHVVHPDIAGGQNCRALTSHIDLAPSLLAMAGVDRGKVADIAGRELPGRDLTPLLGSPAAADIHAARESILFTYSGLVLNDSNVLQGISEAVAAGENPKDPATLAKRGIKPDLTKRGSMRTVFDGRYKFTRYFAPIQRNRPETIDALYRNNDVELFDLQTDPQEMHNLATDKAANGDLLLAMNAKLEAAISTEFGVDDGREMPDFKGIAWALGTAD